MRLYCTHREFQHQIPDQERAGVAMISGIILVFAVPMVIAALLISPTGFHNLIHGLPLYAVLGVVLPIDGWMASNRPGRCSNSTA